MSRKPSKRSASKKPSKGLGDDIEKITKATGIKTLVDKVSKALGVDCGCETRKEFLNAVFPHQRIKEPTSEEVAFIERTQITIDGKGREVVLYSHNADYRTLWTLYNKLLGRKASFPTCRCDATRRWFVHFAQELKKIEIINQVK